MEVKKKKLHNSNKIFLVRKDLREYSNPTPLVLQLKTWKLSLRVFCPRPHI